MNTSTLETFLGRAQFQAMSQTRYTEVLLPDDKKVRIRSLSEGEMSRHEVANLGKSGGLNKRKTEETRRRLFALVVVDAGKKIGENAGQGIQQGVKNSAPGINAEVLQAMESMQSFADGLNAAFLCTWAAYIFPQLAQQGPAKGRRARAALDRSRHAHSRGGRRRQDVDDAGSRGGH